ncbi:MAG: hypothetical protein HC817_16300 [Saprospiraceae bacterium]|nr:hypothetical protein [Saprospiraceae bacterium]
MESALLKKEVAKVMSIIDTMFANIPNQIFIRDAEKYYHSMMHLMLTYLGTYIESEVNTSDGRIDSIVHAPKYIYAFEFKLDASADAALKQIHEKGYLSKYKHRKKTLSSLWTIKY